MWIYSAMYSVLYTLYTYAFQSLRTQQENTWGHTTSDTVWKSATFTQTIAQKKCMQSEKKKSVSHCIFFLSKYLCLHLRTISLIVCLHNNTKKLGLIFQIFFLDKKKVYSDLPEVLLFFWFCKISEITKTENISSFRPKPIPKWVFHFGQADEKTETVSVVENYITLYFTYRKILDLLQSSRNTNPNSSHWQLLNKMELYCRGHNLTRRRSWRLRDLSGYHLRPKLRQTRGHCLSELGLIKDWRPRLPKLQRPLLQQ